MSRKDEDCDFHCGYVSSGQDLAEHVHYEHAPCPECGAGEGQDLRTCSLTHKLDCPRLQPGYTYPDVDDRIDQAMGWL